jgi:hypothetical protein
VLPQSLTFHWELSVAKEIRFHFRKHSTLGPAFLSSFRKALCPFLNLGRGVALRFSARQPAELLCRFVHGAAILI